jgi:hypothetical protein
MKKSWCSHIAALGALTIFVVLGSACSSTSGVSSASSETSKQTVQYWTGDGGKGTSLAILPPQVTGLAENQKYLPALVQGEFVSNFSTYSAILVLDRQRLDNQYAELLSGYYDDNAVEGMDLGHLTPTTHILGGNITRTATGYALQMYITKSSDKMTVATYSGTFPFNELDDLSGIRRASIELLQKMGVTLTAKAQDELAGPPATNHVNAQTALAQGITAQQQGNNVAAINYFFQAAAYEPSLREAVDRTSTLAAYIEGGISFSTPISGSITTANPSNRFTIILLLPGRVSVSVTNDGSSRALPNQGANLQWLDADGTMIAGSSGGFSFPYNEVMDLGAGVYNIEVIGIPGIGNTGTYSIRVDYNIDEREPNNTRANAQILVSGLTVGGQLTVQDERDMFRYDLTQPGRLSVYISGGTLPSYRPMFVNWLDVNGAKLKESGEYWSFPYNQEMDLEAGSYFIEIIKRGDATGTYNLRGNYTPAGNNEIEPNNTRSNAQPLTPGQSVRGLISYQDDRDMYRYDLTLPGRLTLNITGGTLPSYRPMFVNWLDVNGAKIKESGEYWSFPYNQSMDLEAGIYFIEIIKRGDAMGTYNLRGNYSPAGNNEIEPNNTRQTAQLLTSGQTVIGSISLQDDRDMYRYDLTQPGRLTVNITGGTLPSYRPMFVNWLDVNGAKLKESGEYWSFPYNQSMDLEAGIYFIEIVRRGDTTGTYNLSGRIQ